MGIEERKIAKLEIYRHPGHTGKIGHRPSEIVKKKKKGKTQYALLGIVHMHYFFALMQYLSNRFSQTVTRGLEPKGVWPWN